MSKRKLVAAMAADMLALLLSGILAGALVGIWLGFNPAGLDATAYILQQQHAIRTLNVPMPVLGVSALATTLIAGGLAYRDRARLLPLLTAAMCLLAAGLVTRMLNQPINAVVMTWSPAAPPAEWINLRDEWWSWHTVRVLLSLVAFCLIIGASMTRAYRERAVRP